MRTTIIPINPGAIVVEGEGVGQAEGVAGAVYRFRSRNSLGRSSGKKLIGQEARYPRMATTIRCTLTLRELHEAD